MTKEQFSNSYVSKTVGGTTIHCDENEVNEGLEKLQTFLNNADTVMINIDKCIQDFRGLNGFYGVVQNNCLSEDNVLFDLDIPSYTKDDNTEHILDDFPDQTKDIKECVNSVKVDIKNTADAVKMYAESDKYSSEELKAAAAKVSLFDDYERIQKEGGALADTIAERTKIAEQITNGTFVNPKKLQAQQVAANGGVKRATVGAVKASATSVPDVKTSSFKATTISQPAAKTVTTETVSPIKTEEKNLASDADKSFNKTAEGKVTTGEQKDINVKQISKDDLLKTDTTKTNVQNTTTTTGTCGTVHGGGGFNSNGYSFSGNTATSTTASTTAATPIVATSIAKKATDTAKKTAEAVKLGTVKGIANVGEKGSLASSISAAQARNIGTISKIEKPIDNNSSTTTPEQNKAFVLPTAAALSAASVAGIGTKVYVNQAAKDKAEKEEENNNERVVMQDVVTQQPTKIQDELDIEEKKHSSFDGFIIEENEF